MGEVREADRVVPVRLDTHEEGEVNRLRQSIGLRTQRTNAINGNRCRISHQEDSHLGGHHSGSVRAREQDNVEWRSGERAQVDEGPGGDSRKKKTRANLDT